MRTLEELKGDLVEVRAYRALQNEPFDFGTGVIKNNSNNSEDAYYKMQEQEIIEEINRVEAVEFEKEKRRYLKKENRYYSDKKAKNRLKKLHEQGVYSVYKAKNKDNGKEYLYKFYLSGRKKMAKKQTNKKVRNRNNFPLKGAGYRKVYDYWWEVY